MIFACIGNCQTASISKYIRDLPDNHESFWLCYSELWKQKPWPKDIRVFGEEQIKFHVFKDDRIQEVINTCDVIIYQPSFEVLHFINKYNPINKIHVTLSPIFVDDIEYMKRKEEKYQASICVSKIIEDNRDLDLFIKQSDHPTSFVYLEIIRRICDMLSISFFSQEKYQKLLNSQYPKYK